MEEKIDEALWNEIFTKLNDNSKYINFSIEHAKKYGVKNIAHLSEWLFGFRDISNKDFKNYETKGLVEKYSLSEEEVINYLKQKTPQKILKIKNLKIYICEWCQCESYTIHKHHYPVRKREQGQEIVQICANCHSEFHILCDKSLFKIKEEILFTMIDLNKELA